MSEFWHNHIRDVYAEIRKSQAEKLHSLNGLLSRDNYREIEGSLISPTDISSPEKDGHHYLEKRLNYVLILNQLHPKRMLEIGFNWGYSASLLLEGGRAGTLRSIDIASHWYAKPAGELIEGIYPGRFSAVWKESHEALRDEIAAGNAYDLIVVDGGHRYEIARLDIVLSLAILNPGGVLVVDDTDSPSVRAAVLATVARDETMMELTPDNMGLFPFERRDYACFEQRYYLRRFTAES